MGTVIKESDSKFRLTGINMLERGQGPHYIPTDPAIARIGGKNSAGYDNTVFTQFYAASINLQPRQYQGSLVGYIVHAHCWALFGQIEGLQLNQATIAKLVQTCRKFLNKNEIWGISGIMYSVGPCDPFCEPEYGCDIYQSPLVIGAVQKAILKAKEDALRSSSTRSITPLRHFINLPFEIAILIAEIICPVNYTLFQVNDTREMLSVFKWSLPDWFWRRR
jgi:hypothetical protein